MSSRCFQSGADDTMQLWLLFDDFLEANWWSKRASTCLIDHLAANCMHILMFFCRFTTRNSRNAFYNLIIHTANRVDALFPGRLSMVLHVNSRSAFFGS